MKTQKFKKSVCLSMNLRMYIIHEMIKNTLENLLLSCEWALLGFLNFKHKMMPFDGLQYDFHAMQEMLESNQT